MAGVDAFVTEVAVELEDLFETAHQQTLEVQLGRDAHVELEVQGVVVGLEGAGGGATGHGLHHGRLHFHEAALFEEAAELAHDHAALAEDLAGALGDDEVHIALAVAGLHVLEAVILFRQGTHGARDELEVATGDGQLARLGMEKMAGHADDVAHVQLLHYIINLFGQFLAAGVALDAAALVHDVEEGHLAEGTQRDDAAGDGEHVPLGFQLFGAQAAEIVQHPADGMFLAEIIGEQRHTGVQQVTGFDDAVFDDFVEHVALGKALKHGHEIGGVLRLGIQLDLLLLRTLFPVFHCKLLLRAWPGPLSGSTVEWLEVCHSGPVVKVRGRGTSAAQGCLSARKMIK